MNYDHAEINSQLVNYYKGLIKLRNKHDAFKKSPYRNYNFINIDDNEFAIAYELEYKNQQYFTVFNANPDKKLEIYLPSGWWKILADEKSVMKQNSKSVKGKIVLNPTTGIVLKKK